MMMDAPAEGLMWKVQLSTSCCVKTLTAITLSLLSDIDPARSVAESERYIAGSYQNTHATAG